MASRIAIPPECPRWVGPIGNISKRGTKVGNSVLVGEMSWPASVTGDCSICGHGEDIGVGGEMSLPTTGRRDCGTCDYMEALVVETDVVG